MRRDKHNFAVDRRGPNVGDVSQRATLAAAVTDSKPLLSWKSPNGVSRAVTVIGGAPLEPQLALADLVEVGVVLRYRTGGVWHIDRWGWNPGGWRRTLFASEVSVHARRIPDAGTLPVTVSAGLALGAAGRDECVLPIRFTGEGTTGVVVNQVRFPHGTQEFRVWQRSATGEFGLGQMDDHDNFITYYSGLTLADLDEWLPVGSINAIITQIVEDGSLAWVHCRG